MKKKHNPQKINHALETPKCFADGLRLHATLVSESVSVCVLGWQNAGVTWSPCSLGRSTEEGVVLKTAAPDAEPRQPGAFTLRVSLGLVGPTVQLLEQLLSILTSPLEKGDCLHPTDSWSDFSVDLSTMVIVHCCKRQGKGRLNMLLKIYTWKEKRLLLRYVKCNIT